jgi:hypothetical protein
LLHDRLFARKYHETQKKCSSMNIDPRVDKDMRDTA